MLEFNRSVLIYGPGFDFYVTTTATATSTRLCTTRRCTSLRAATRPSTRRTRLSASRRPTSRCCTATMPTISSTFVRSLARCPPPTRGDFRRGREPYSSCDSERPARSCIVLQISYVKKKRTAAMFTINFFKIRQYCFFLFMSHW